MSSVLKAIRIRIASRYNVVDKPINKFSEGKKTFFLFKNLCRTTTITRLFIYSFNAKEWEMKERKISSVDLFLKYKK